MHNLLMGHGADDTVDFCNILQKSVPHVMPMWRSSSPCDQGVNALGLVLLCRVVQDEVPFWEAYQASLSGGVLACQQEQVEAIWTLLGEL